MGNTTPSVCISQTWKGWGVNEFYSCPEIIVPMLVDYKFLAFKDLTKLFDIESGISLTDPNIASLITRAMIKNATDENLEKLRVMYGLDNKDP
jgi:hypothetical protein